MDPRLNVVSERLEDIERIVVVSGGKGGVGKSLTASVIALILAESGYRVGLLDLDLSTPSTHVILGIDEDERNQPIEDKGIIPPKVYGIEFMSIVYFTINNPTPLRNVDIHNATLELLAVTKWKMLNFLIVDMPPGIGDATMDVIKLMKKPKPEFLLLTTSSKLALQTVKKEIKLLKSLKMPIIGVIENMKIEKEKSEVKKELLEEGVSVLGSIDFDSGIEKCIGNVDKLFESYFSMKIREFIFKALKLGVKVEV